MGEVRVRRLSAQPYPDGRRVRVAVGLTPFLDRPNLEFEVFNAVGESVGATSVIESVDHELDLTLHLRGPLPGGRHTLRVTLSYFDGPPPISAETEFEV